MGMTSGNVTQRFCYDVNGSVISVAYNGTYYYYLRNAQGDIVKLIDKNGQTVVEYTCDTWGKVISVTGSLASTLGKDNPFRYRGYVYDNETGWYYLQSRYYDSNTCRFVSADVMLSTGQGVLGHNSFAYCLNNPVNMEDSEGNFGLFTLIGATVGAVVGGISAAITGDSIIGGIASGAVSGAISGAAADLIVCTGGIAAVPIIMAGGAASGVAGEWIGSLFADEDEKSTVGDYIVAGVTGALTGLMTFGMDGGASGIISSSKELKTFGTKLVKNVVKKTVSSTMKKKALSFAAENLATEALTSGIALFAKQYRKHWANYLNQQNYAK